MALEMPNLKIKTVNINELRSSEYNPRKWSESATEQLAESIRRFGLVDPILCNQAAGRENVVIGGHFRLKVAKELGYTEVPVAYVNIPDLAKEKELNIRLNKNLGEWDFALLKKFDESLLEDIGFTSEEVDDIFDVDMEEKETFNIQKALAKANMSRS